MLSSKEGVEQAMSGWFDLCGTLYGAVGIQSHTYIIALGKGYLLLHHPRPRKIGDILIGGFSS